MTICTPCGEEQLKWLDSRPSQVIPRHGIHDRADRPYEAIYGFGRCSNSVGHYEEWSRLVRFQMDLIARTCRTQGHTAPIGVLAPRVVQLDLFELIGGGP